MQCGDLADALAVFRKQLPLLQFIVAGGLPRTVAAGLKIMGIDAGHQRAPLADIVEADKDRLAEILKALA